MRKNLRKMLCLVLLAVAALCFTVPALAIGTVSDNITWTQEGSTLNIEGSGDMVLEYEYLTEIPWYHLKTEVDTILIGEGVTSIAEGAFTAFRLVKRVELPQSLSVIGPSAFLSCEGLENVTLPDRVIKIESGAFVGCESLKTISIPGNTYEISADAFYNCFDLTIKGISGSYAEDFAKMTGIPFRNERPLPKDIFVTVNHIPVWFDQPPTIVDDRTLVPLRAIFEAMGANVDWNANTRTVTAVRGEDKLSLVIDTNIINKNGTDFEIDVPAMIIGDRTMVPARAIAEALGASVDWNPHTRTVIIDD